MKLSHKEIISCCSFCCESSSGELKGKLRVLTSPTGRAAREGVAMGAEPGDVPWSPSSPHWCWPPWNFPLHRHLFLPAPLVVLRSLSVINSLNWQPSSSPYFLSSSFTEVFKKSLSYSYQNFISPLSLREFIIFASDIAVKCRAKRRIKGNYWEFWKSMYFKVVRCNFSHSKKKLVQVGFFHLIFNSIVALGLQWLVSTEFFFWQALWISNMIFKFNMSKVTFMLI